MGQLQVLQNKAAKVLLDLPPRSSSTEALNHLDLKILSKRRYFHCCVMIHFYQTRRINDLHIPRVCTNWGKQNFILQAFIDWTNLDNDIENTTLFKANFKLCKISQFVLFNFYTCIIFLLYISTCILISFLSF